jgi:mRNA-degrading endonuclease YafQ of YafQ-DinJ toxin-antitoxin module
MPIKFHKKFVKRLNKLPNKIQIAFYNKLEIFISNKFDNSLNNHALNNPYKNKRSINVTSDYRAMFEEFEDKIIFITIGTHSDLY